jgi:predicted dehydrogenase
MIRVALIGAGGHAAAVHAPALRRCAEARPGQVRLAAVCDLDFARAESVRRAFGFDRAVARVGDLFASGVEPPDALVVILPIAVMCRATVPLMRRGLPMLIEKPLGRNLREAGALVRAARAVGLHGRVMVSLNRRFDPAILRARAWLADQPAPHYARAAMYRDRRPEPDFLWGTGLHVLDALDGLVGPLELKKNGANRPGPPGNNSLLARFQGRDGCEALFEMFPDSGEWEETFRIAGPGYMLDIRTGTLPPWRVRAVRHARVVLEESGAADEPPCVSNGAAAETEAFLDAVAAGKPFPAASLEDAFRSARLAAAVERRSLT